MQNNSRVYERDLRKFLYPRRNEYEREKEYRKSPKKLSYLSNEYMKRQPNLNLYYHYDDEHQSPSTPSYILNKELNRNALAYTKDENQFSVLDNNYIRNYNSNIPFSYKSRTNYKPERKIYHYSIASRKDYSRDKEEDYSLFYYPDQKSRKYYIERRTTPYKERKSYNKTEEENILPNRVYISDSYNCNKAELYKSRPSREKDGYKGGIVNLKRKNYSTPYEINNVILIQRWWRNLLNKYNRNENDNNNEYNYYPSVASRKTYSKGNERITEKIIPGENDKFIVQTTRVEVFKNPYMNKPILKPEILTKENKLNIKNNDNEINRDFDIVLDKDALKQHMANIWNEENMSTSAESLNIIQNDSSNNNNFINIKKITINYEEQIKLLKITLNKKEKELIETKNKLRSLPNNKNMDNLQNLENNAQDLKYENYLKKDDIVILERQKQFDDDLKIQLVDKFFIKNVPNIFRHKKKLFDENIIENMYNLEIIPIEKGPLKKQLVDSLYIEGPEIFKSKEEIITSSYYKKKLIQINKFSPEKILIEEKVNLEILPIEKAPLKKQLVDNLFIEGFIFMRPDNKIQNINKLNIFKTSKPRNIIETRENLEILPIEKDALKKQLIDALYIEGLNLTKPENKIQNIDKIVLTDNQKIKNMIELIDNIQIEPIKKKPLKLQIVDNLYIERLLLKKPENIIQNIDKITFMEQKPENAIELKENLEILPIEKEPLQKQLIDSLFIEGLLLTKPQNKIQNIDQLSIFKISKPINVIEAKDYLVILPKEKEPLKKQLIDDLYIESKRTKIPENKIQNIEQISIYKTKNPKNIIEIETKDNIELLCLKKEPLEKQLVDNLFIEKNILIKPENKIQNIDKLSLITSKKPNNNIEIRDTIELLPIEKEPLEKQLVDDLFIEKNALIKQENKIQNIDKILLFSNKKPNNNIEIKDNIELLSLEKEPLKKQLVDDLFIEKLTFIKPENKIQDVDKITILKAKKPNNNIEIRDTIELLSIEKESLKKQLVDDLFIEKLTFIKPDNKIQDVDKITIFKIQKPQNKIEANANLVILPKVKEPLQKQLADDLYIEGTRILPAYKNLSIECNNDITILENKGEKPLLTETCEAICIEGLEKDDNKIQQTSLMTILKSQKTPYIIESIEDSFINSKVIKPLLCQLVDDLKIEGNNKIQNEIQLNDRLEILKKPRKLYHFIEERNNIEILPKEKDLLKAQIIDKLKIEGNMKDENKIQVVDKIGIMSALRPPNIIEEKESIFIPPKEKEILKNQNVDNILFEGNNNKNDNEIQKVDKIEILKTPKPKNIIQLNDSMFIEPKEKEEFKMQIIDELLIEEKKRPENEMQQKDKVEILRAPNKVRNLIECNSNLFIPKIDKKPLKIKKIDEILVEGNNRPNYIIQRLDVLSISEAFKTIEDDNNIENIIEHNDDLYIPSKEKMLLKSQVIDSILVDGNTRPNNKIQNIDKIDILKTQKPENIIEQNDNLFIEPKKRDILKSQIIDNILVEAINRKDNAIQKIDKMEILKTPKPTNIIEEKDNLYIKSKEKEPLMNQIIDKLLIDGEHRNDNEIQKVDKMEILKTPKPKNIIQLNDSMFIESQKNEKKPLKNQIIDNIFVEGNNKPNNEIQIVDKLNILKSPKPQNVMQEIDKIFIEQEEKKQLEYQTYDRLLIEGNNRFNNEIQKIDVLEIPETLQNIKEIKMNIKHNDDLYIPAKEKIPLKSQVIDSILVDGNTRPNNKIQNIEKINILKTQKPENIIEQNDNLFIKSKDKAPLKNQIIDKILIEGNLKPNNKIQDMDKLEILKKIKPQNKIEQSEKIYISPSEKEPLEMQLVDILLFDEELKPENICQSGEKIEILKTSKPKNENCIEQKDDIFLSPKEKKPLEKQLTDKLLIEGNLKPEFKIQPIEQAEILKTPKPENIIQQNEYLNIESEKKGKEPLEMQNIDKLFIERNKIPENDIQKMDKIELFGINKPKNTIEHNENIDILSDKKEKEPLKNKTIDNILIEGNAKPDNNIEKLDNIEILKSPKPKPENKVEEKDNIFICPEEKKPLNNQVVDNIIIEGNEHPQNDIQKAEKIEILKSSKTKPKNQIEEKENIFIPPKEKEPLDKHFIDNISIEGINRPDNEIENTGKFNILKTNIKRPENKIEEISSIFIDKKEKCPLESQNIDEIVFEGNNRQCNKIQPTNKLEILRTQKPKNLIVENKNIFIPPKKRESLINQKIDYITIEGNYIPDNEIQLLDEINIPKTIKRFENIIEDNCHLFIKPREKDPLEYQIIDRIYVEEEVLPKIQENDIEENINLTILPEKKDPLQKQIVDNIIVKPIDTKKNEIQTVKSFDILKTKKPENETEKKSYLNINDIEKKPLEYQSVNEFYIESLLPKFSGDKNQIENSEKFNLPGKEKEKDKNLSLPESKEPLAIEKSQVYIEGLNKPEEEEKDDNNKLKLRTKYIPKNNYMIQKLEDININNIKEEKNKKSKNEIQKSEYFEIKPKKGQNINLEIRNFEIMPMEEEKIKTNKNGIEKDEEHKEVSLIEDKMDDLIFNEIIRPKNIIENVDKFVILTIQRTQNQTLLKYDKIKDLYISGNKKPNKQENLIQQTFNFDIPKIQREPNQISYIDKIKLFPKEDSKKQPLQKEKETLQKENIEDFYIIGNNKPLKTNFKNKNANKIKHIDSILMKPKDIEPLIEEQIDELNIEGEKRPENVIESVKKVKILKQNKPQNEIENLESIMISSLQENKVKEIFKSIPNNEIQNTVQIDIPKNIKKLKKALIKDNIKELYIEGSKDLIAPINLENLIKTNIDNINIEGSGISTKILPKNEIGSQENIFIPSNKKGHEPLIIENNQYLYLERNPLIYILKYKEKLLEDKAMEIKIYGQEKNAKVVPENEIIVQKELFIPSLKKNCLIDNNPKNEIINIDTIIIPSKEKETLIEEKRDNINIPGKNEAPIKEANMKINNINPIFIEAKKKQPLQKEFANEVTIFNNLDKDNESKLLLLKRKGIKFTNIYEDNNDQFFIKGIFKKEQINNNIKENKDTIFINGLTKSESEEEINNQSNIKEKRPYEICSQIESFNIEKSIEPEKSQELYILRNRYRQIQKEIKPIRENNILIKGLSQSEKIIPKEEIYPQNKEQKYQVNEQFSILSERKKPYIIENNPNLTIFAEGKSIINNNLIVQGTCSGLFVPGQMTQDIENLKIINNWNDNNYPQKTVSQTIKGNDNKIDWNDFIVEQKGVNFDINKTIKPLHLKIINQYNFSIINKKEKEDEIVQDDYNYISLEKDIDDKQRRTVKATITKVERERLEDGNNIDDLDPFSSCKKHTGKKYDKIFKERKTTSVRIKDNEIIPGSIIIKDENEKKKDNSIFTGKSGGTVIINDSNNRKTGPVLLKKINEQPKDDRYSHQFKDNSKSKSQVMFKSKEKNIEYLRDYDNEPGYFN